MPNSSPARPHTLEAALQSAIAALRAGDAAEAERLAAQVLKAGGGHALAGKLLGQARLMQGRAAEALAPLEQVAREGDPDAEVLLARALTALGRDEDAQGALRRAVTYRPAFPLAFLEFGDRLARAGELVEAAAVFEEGRALAPDAAVLAIGLGYVRLQQGKRAAAQALFAEVHAAAPTRHDALLGLARVAAADGDHAAAAVLYRQALNVRPDDDATRISLARRLFELGDRTGGEAALITATHGGEQLVWEAITTLSATPHGRAFASLSAARAFLRGERG
jgi:tetratricopeptide (TPR) repeat protein